MKIDNWVSSEFLTTSKIGRVIIPAMAVSLITVALFLVFTVVPNERIMGPVQRIFYFHVPSAIAAYVMVGLLCLASVFYLRTKSPSWDLVCESAASVGFLFCTMVLCSGMIWGHSAWNTWWRWEPRLVSFLVLWLIFFSYVTLRNLTEKNEKQANFSAILGIIAAVNVPIIVFSIKLLSHAEQLHPQIIANQGLKDPSYVYTLILGIFAMTSLSLWFCWMKLTNLALKRELIIVQRELGND